MIFKRGKEIVLGNRDLEEDKIVFSDIRISYFEEENKMNFGNYSRCRLNQIGWSE